MNQHGGADLDGADDLAPGGNPSQRADVIRLLLVLALLVGVAFVVMAAGHAVQPDCGGG
jgi:hypothetical protein